MNELAGLAGIVESREMKSLLALPILLLSISITQMGGADRDKEEVVAAGAYRPDQGGVALTFDDRNFSDWVTTIPLFEKYGVKATFFISGAINSQALDAAKELQKHGHAIGAHGLHHKKAVDYSRERSVEEYVRAEIRPQLEVFETAGIKVTSFAYPNSQNDETTDRALLAKFRHLRTGRGLATGERISGKNDFYVPAGEMGAQGCLSGKGIDYAPSMDDRTFGQLDAALVRAAAKNEILVLYAHGIAVKKRGHHVTPEALEHIFRKARELKLPFYSFDQLP
jgi:peptidoglycan-N-acetylglucosamine deacetylase